MELLIYFLMLIAGIGLVIIALVQKKRDGGYSRRSKTILNIGTVLITYAILVKLPDFIKTVIDFWK